MMNSRPLSLKEIESILPQRYPFLLIDKVLDYKENDYLVAVKNITGNEWALGEKQDQLSVFPEMLLVEAALQASILLYHISKNLPDENPSYFIGKIESRFSDLPRVGDSPKISVFAEKLMRSGGYASIKVENQKEKLVNMDIFFSVKR